MFSYCKSVQKNNGYTSTFEILIPYAEIGVSSNVGSLNFTASGWFENGWCWLLNGSWQATHTVTGNGLSEITN